MLFLRFCSHEERRNYGGSSFIELQFCKLPPGTKSKKLVRDISFWCNDSLYVYDDHIFFQEYRHFFDNGIQNNLRKGPLDIYGVNYFAPVLVGPIIDQLLSEKPKEYEILVSWLTDAKKYNGFYILGL